MDTVTPAPAAAVHACAGEAVVMENLLLAATAAAEVTSFRKNHRHVPVHRLVVLVGFDSAFFFLLYNNISRPRLACTFDFFIRLLKEEGGKYPTGAKAWPACLLALGR